MRDLDWDTEESDAMETQQTTTRLSELPPAADSDNEDYDFFTNRTQISGFDDLDFLDDPSLSPLSAEIPPDTPLVTKADRSRARKLSRYRKPEEAIEFLRVGTISPLTFLNNILDIQDNHFETQKA